MRWSEAGVEERTGFAPLLALGENEGGFTRQMLDEALEFRVFGKLDGLSYLSCEFLFCK